MLRTMGAHSRVRIGVRLSKFNVPFKNVEGICDSRTLSELAPGGDAAVAS